jgi:hypothetical protein
VEILISRWSGGLVLVVIQCLAHWAGQEAQRLHRSVWLGARQVSGGLIWKMVQGLGGLVEGRHGVTKIGAKWRWARWLAYPDEGAAARCGERCRYNLLIGAELSAYKVMGGGARHCV